MLNETVIVITERDTASGIEPLELLGQVERVDIRPWGTDVIIRLQEPTRVGNLGFNVEVEYLSLSINSPHIRLVGDG